MKKQRNRNRFKAHVTSAMQKFADIYMGVMRDLAPLIKKDAMAPNTAIVLVAIYADAVMVGDRHKAEHRMSEDDIVGAVNLLLLLWEQGKVVAPNEYPYTLEETLADGGDVQ